MRMNTAKLRTEEYSRLLKGLLDAVVELYPDAGYEDDERFFAVLIQAHRVATELEDHVQDGDDELTPFSVVG